MAEVLGTEVLATSDLDRLKAAGKLPTKPAMPMDTATAAHVLGVMSGAMPAGDPERLSSKAFWQINREQPAVMTSYDIEAIEMARARMGQYITGLGTKLDDAVGKASLDVDDTLRRKQLGKLRREVAASMEAGESVKQLADRLAASIKGVTRDWMQIAQTEIHNAVEEGKAVSLMGSVPAGTDPLVFKRPRPEACPYCVLLYLQADGITPRIFRLSELLANGTNVGRKANRPKLRGLAATQWQPVLGAMHPWCQCQLHHLPEGMGFDDQGRMTYVKKSVVEIETLSKALADHECIHGR
jgi:hypothetical protein